MARTKSEDFGSELDDLSDSMSKFMQDPEEFVGDTLTEEPSAVDQDVISVRVEKKPSISKPEPKPEKVAARKSPPKPDRQPDKVETPVVKPKLEPEHEEPVTETKVSDYERNEKLVNKSSKKKKTRNLNKKPKKQRKLLTSSKVLRLTSGFAAVAVIAFFGYNFVKARGELAEFSKNPEAVTGVQTQKTVDRVAELYAIPDETPKIATVSDVTALKDQAFFSRAENGDKVLYFSNSQVVVLYRPGTNKIIEIFSNVSLTNNQISPTNPSEDSSETTTDNSGDGQVAGAEDSKPDQ